MKFFFHALLAFLLASSVVADEGDDEYLNSFSVCEDSVVTVNQISLLCDSPGTYYYGSGKYRNSAKCQAGDKAKLEIELEVTEDLEEVAYLTVYVEGYGTVSNADLYTEQSMCSISSLSSAYGSSPCSDSDSGLYPKAGSYYLKERFYWGSQDDSYDYSFTPKVVVGVKSNLNKQQFDLGGANTYLCDGNSFMKWTTGVGQSAANTLRTFLITFGILTGSILAIVLSGWCIMRIANRPAPKETIEEELLDSQVQNKIAMVGKNRDLVDVF